MSYPAFLPPLRLTTLAALLFSSALVHAARPAIEAGFIPSMDKVRRSDFPKNPTKSVSLNAARGEGESAQLIVFSKEESLKNVRVTSTGLTREDKAPPLEIEISVVGYVPIDHPTPDGYGVRGDYPDILRNNQSFDLPKGQSQAVWLTIWVPATTPPGVYRGSLMLVADGCPEKEFPVEVTVHQTILPRQGILKTAFGYSPWIFRLPQYYGAEWEGSNTERAFLTKMLDYRLSYSCAGLNLFPSLARTFHQDDKGVWQADWGAFDQEVTAHLNAGVNFFEIAHIPLPYYIKDNERLVIAPRKGNLPEYRREDQAAILELINHHIVEKGWKGRFGWRLFDEPLIIPENVSIITELADFIHAHSPDIPLMVVTTDTRERDLADKRSRYLWVPHLPSLGLADGYEAFLQQQQKIGEQAWTYICVTRIIGSTREKPISHPFPDVGGIDRTGTSQRAFGLLAWRNRLDGFLYWAAADWDYFHGYLSPKNPYKGEGVLFYPDMEEKGVPFASMRAAYLRDGFEDHDLLFLLSQKIEEKSKSQSANAAKAIAKAKALLDLSKLVPTLEIFNRNSAPYDQRHAEVLHALDELNAL